MFLNHYRCPRCDHDWADEWSCMVDDECPSCGCRDISPEASEDIGDDDDSDSNNERA